MIITDDIWDRYIKRLGKINDEAARKMFSYLAKNEWFRNNKTKQAAIDYAFALATQYGEAATAAACDMYDAVAGIAGYGATPAPTATYAEVAKAFNGAAKTDNPKLISDAVSRLVKLAGVDTTVQNAIRDGMEWAWIPSGDTCAFCLTLASQGWVEASDAVLNGGHVEHVHANCDCTFAIRKDSRTEYPGYDPAKYKRIYDNADGRTWQEKVRAIDRDNYAANREEINARKRAEYAAREEKEQ